MISAEIASGFIKNGAGTLILSGNNTYTGGTMVSGGTLTAARFLRLVNSSLMSDD